jgi:tetratricopeptide (TPR) repeat protein
MLATAGARGVSGRPRRAKGPAVRLTRVRVVSALAVIVSLAAWALWPHLRFTYRIETARKLLETGNPDLALGVLTPEEDLHPDSAELQFLLGISRRRSDQLRDSHENFRRAAALGWPLKLVRPQQLMAAFQAGDPTAEMELRALLDQPLDDDQAEQVFEALAKGYFGRFWLNQAKTCLDHWIEWRPKNPRPRHLRTMIFGLSGDLELQIEDFRAILEINPLDAAAHGLLADALLKTNKVDDALQQYRWCREHVLNDNLAALGMSVCLRRKGQLDDARRLLSEVTATAPTGGIKGRLLSELGELNLETGDPKTAVEYLRQAVELLPFDGPAHYSYAMALSRLGRKAESKETIDRASQLEKRSERLFDLERQLAALPNDADLRYEAGVLLKEQKMKDEAVTLLLSALKLDPAHEASHKALAEIYQEEGKMDLAEAHRTMAAAGADAGATPGAIPTPAEPIVVVPQGS